MSLEQKIFTIIFNAIDCGAENSNAEKAWLTIHPHGTDYVLSSWLGEDPDKFYMAECLKIIDASSFSLTLTSPCEFIRNYVLRNKQ